MPEPAATRFRASREGGRPHLGALPVTRFVPAAARRGKGGPEAHPAGTRSALPAARRWRHAGPGGARNSPPGTARRAGDRAIPVGTSPKKVRKTVNYGTHPPATASAIRPAQLRFPSRPFVVNRREVLQRLLVA